MASGREGRLRARGARLEERARSRRRHGMTGRDFLLGILGGLAIVAVALIMLFVMAQTVEGIVR